jgi:hypothetical protein
LEFGVDGVHIWRVKAADLLARLLSPIVLVLVLDFLTSEEKSAFEFPQFGRERLSIFRLWTLSPIVLVVVLVVDC